MRQAFAKKPKVVIDYVTVPRVWPGSTVVCLAGGPSLCQADVDACRGVTKVLAIKDAIRLAPWADVLYSCEFKWWRAHPETAAYTGPKYGMEATPGRDDVRVLRNSGDTGLEIRPNGLKNGRNSGYQAINLAVHFGATTIVLLGYDMHPDVSGKQHWFGGHSYNPHGVPPYQLFLERFDTIVEPLKKAGITVLNATPDSSLRCFPMVSLADALKQVTV